MYIKTIDRKTLETDNAFLWSRFSWKNGSIDENMKDIYKKRMCYVRIELQSHEGIAPGSIAVL